MSDEAPHPTPRPTGAGPTLLRLLLWLFVLVAGLAVVLVLPMILVLNAVGGTARPAPWPLYVWLPLVFLAAIWSVVAGLQAMNRPRLRQVVVLAAIALLAFLSFPLFWLAES